MTIYQISRIQNRRGTSGELPDALAEGEIGMTTDTGEVLIGAPNHPSVSGRNSYPYQNIKILTELDINRSITGDVYYHGPLINVDCPSNGTISSVVPLFTSGSVSFANYDFSLQSNDGTVKLVGMLTVCVHPTDPNQSVVNVVSGATCILNWPGGLANTPTSTSGHFTLRSLDNTGANVNTTWLGFKNKAVPPQINRQPIKKMAILEFLFI